MQRNFPCCDICDQLFASLTSACLSFKVICTIFRPRLHSLQRPFIPTHSHSLLTFYRSPPSTAASELNSVRTSVFCIESYRAGSRLARQTQLISRSYHRPHRRALGRAYKIYTSSDLCRLDCQLIVHGWRWIHRALRAANKIGESAMAISEHWSELILIPTSDGRWAMIEISSAVEGLP